MVTLTYLELTLLSLGAIFSCLLTILTVNHYEALIKKKTATAYKKGYFKGLAQKVIKASELKAE